jgi:hypothetical protein
MVAVLVVSLLMAIIIQVVRYRQLKTLVINQGITLEAAEVNVLNAALAHDNAASALNQYVKDNDNRRAKNVPLEIPVAKDGEDQTLDLLNREVESTRAKRRFLRAVWCYERSKLKRLTWELEHLWSFWPRGGGFEPGVPQLTWKLSDQDAAELEMRLKYMGLTTID